ncbi:hypothetical protein MNBD_NITROSPINAE04-2191 [hydrothermal vent metagenome]|uniref:Methyltransferase type 11 domain-containing protein n=1 Tax=hydrothermal vent metagenome TaxID=652676 RepID=A0A3B1BTN6_9ZZZZ
MDKTEKIKETRIDLIMSSGDDFDPKELSDRIHKRVREKIESGFYDKKEIDRILKIRGRVPDQPDTSNQHLMSILNANWDVAAPIDFHTHRAGFSAKLTKLVKKLYQKFVHRPLKFSFTRQAQFNQAVKTGVEEVFNLRERALFLSQRMTNLDERFADMENRVEQIKIGLGSRVEALDASVKGLNKSLRNIDKQGIFLKGRVIKLLDELKAVGHEKELAGLVEKEIDKLASFDYMLFENIHRGSHDEIKRRLSVYIGWFKGASSVLDVGCGRGEMLELFNENKIKASGVDLNGEAVKECQGKGLNVVEDNALSYLESLPDGSLGGLTAIQFVEHLPVEVMTKFFRLAYEKLEAGAPIAAETINAACLTTFCSAFYLDLSHYKPIHPLALQFLLERIGFEDVRIEYLNPYPEDIRLHPLPEDGSPGLDESVVHEFNQNVMKLNNVLYSHTDYAVVARR